MADAVKEEILIDINLETDQDAFTKLAQLKGAIINNKEETLKLQQAYKQGLITQKEFTTEVVRLEANQKKLSATYSETQRTVTGLKNPFDKLQASLSGNAAVVDKMIPGLGSAASGFMSMTKAALAFIATPIGLVIAALAAAIGLVTAAIKTNDSVADEFEQVWEGIGAVFDVVLKRIGLLGEALVELLQGNFAEAFDKASQAVTGLGDAMVAAYNAGADLAKQLQTLEDDTNKFLLSEQALKNQIDTLILQSKNRALTEAQRIVLNQQAAALEKKLTEEHIALVTRAAALELQKLGQTQELQMKVNESVQEYGARLLASQKFGTDQAKAIVDAVRSVDEAYNSSIKLQEKLQNQRDALIEAQIAKDKKTVEDAMDAEEKEYERQLKTDADRREVKQKQLDEFNKSVRDKELEEIKLHNEEVDAEAQRQFEKDQERKQKEADFIRFVFQTTTNIFAQQLQKANDIGTALLKSFIITGLRIFKKYIELKVVGEAFATPDSVLTFGATGALRAGIMVGIIEAAFAGLEGVINSAEGFAKGGKNSGLSGTRIMAGHGIPIQRSNGDDRLITARVGETIVNEHQKALLGGDAAFSAAGIPGYTTGGINSVVGFATRSATNQILNDQVMRDFMRLMQSQRPVLVLEEFQRVENQKVAVMEGATVLP